VDLEITIDINDKGDLYCLYSDKIDLYKIGKLFNIKRASNIVFNEQKQVWEIINVTNNKIVGFDKNREVAIKKEIKLFQPGGKFCAIH